MQREGGPLGLAPRASVVAEMLVLASLAAALEQRRGFTRADYNRRHPGGALGQLSREVERFVSLPVEKVSKIGGVPHSVEEIYSAIVKEPS